MPVTIQLSVVARASSALAWLGGVLGQLVENVGGLLDLDVDGVLFAQQLIAHDLLRARRAFLRLDLELAEGRVEMLARGLDGGQFPAQYGERDAVECDALFRFGLAQHAQRGIDDLVGVDPAHVEGVRLLREEFRIGLRDLHARHHPLQVHHLVANEDFHAGHLLLQRQVVVGKRAHLVVQLAEIEHRQPGDDHHQRQQGGGDAEDFQADGQSHGVRQLVAREFNPSARRRSVKPRSPFGPAARRLRRGRAAI